MKIPVLRVKFAEPTGGYWDGGKKSGGDFIPVSYYDRDGYSKHPGVGETVRWGCFELNFWFNCGSGRSWKEASAIAKRTLQKRLKIKSTVEII